MTKRRLNLEQKKALFGVLFITPWLLGFVLLMAIPLYQSFRFSLSNLTLGQSGYVLEFIGMENYRRALLVDATFNRSLTDSILEMALNVPLIIFFSLFTAALLTQKFRGRAFARAIIFLPVVLASGVIADLESGNYLAYLMGQASMDAQGNFSSNVQMIELKPLLLEAGMNRQIVNYLTLAVERIYQIISASGVQILIFLAGLQSISPSLYEAAKIEGATGYEAFWKITFPMMTPLILTNTVYSIVDSFYTNRLTGYIQKVSFDQLNFGLGASMSWLYFLSITIVLVIATYFLSKRVFYYD